MPYYHINDDFCKAGSIDCDLDWLIVYHLRKLVNEDKNGVIGFAFPVCGDW